MTYREQVVDPNEIWMEDDGCLLVPSPYGEGWLAFGLGIPLDEDDPRVAKPLIMLFDGKNFVPEAQEHLVRKAAQFKGEHNG